MEQHNACQRHEKMMFSSLSHNFACTLSKNTKLMQISYLCKFQGQLHALHMLPLYATCTFHAQTVKASLRGNKRYGCSTGRYRCSRAWEGSYIRLYHPHLVVGLAARTVSEGSTAVTGLTLMPWLWRQNCLVWLQLQAFLLFLFQFSAPSLLFCDANSTHVPEEPVALLQGS